MGKQKSTEIFECRKCKRDFKTKKGFDNHKCKEERTGRFVCDECHSVYKTMSGFEKHVCDPKRVDRFPKTEKSNKFECKYCYKKYTAETAFLTHKCHQRLRVEELKTAYGRIAFVAYQQFYRSMGRNTKEKTPIDFANSTYFQGFMKFGKFIDGAKITGYRDYIQYLIQYNVKLSSWSSDLVHAIYIRGIIKKEPMESAVEKTFNTMTRWATKSGHEWTDYFRMESTGNIIHNIKMGRISPWVIYNSQSGEEFINRLRKREMDDIFDYIDPTYWGVKFQRHGGLASAARDTLNSVGL